MEISINFLGIETEIGYEVDTDSESLRLRILVANQISNQ